MGERFCIAPARLERRVGEGALHFHQHGDQPEYGGADQREERYEQPAHRLEHDAAAAMAAQ